MEEHGMAAYLVRARKLGGGGRGVEIKVYFPRACPQWPAAQTLSLDIHRILNSTNKWGQSFLTSKPVDFIAKP